MRWLAGVAVLVALGARAAGAHEIGTTQVNVRFESSNAGERSYRIEIVTDAQSLLEKLESVGGSPGTVSTAPALAERLRALQSIFRERVATTFDDRVVQPTVAINVAPPGDDLSPPIATLTLTGDVPRGAARFCWQYGWTFASYALRVADQPGTPPTTVWLEGGETSRPYEIGAAVAPISRTAIARQYVWLGLTHIVPYGLDHVLFVLGLFLLSPRLRSVLWQVSAFTLAHSITLGLGIYGVIGTPPAIVEPLIALSIGYVAVENLVRSELRPWRVALVFAFGLLHGMGFAGVLTELGLPRSEFVTALVAFNVGVESGQLLVIAGAFTLVGWYRARPMYRRLVVVPASLAIACAAFYWTVERVGILQ